MDKYFIKQIVFAIMIIALIIIMLPISVGLAVVGCFALAFFIYQRWRSKQWQCGERGVYRDTRNNKEDNSIDSLPSVSIPPIF